MRERAYRANNQGVALLERFQYAEAAEAFRQALQIDGSVAIARFNLSLALLYAQDLAGAAREAAEADRAMPSAPHPPYVLGLLARADNRTADAIREFERVRRIDRRDVGTGVNLGQVLLEERRYDEAIPLLREAASAEPFNVTAVYNLGLALTRAGQEAEGRDALARAQSLRSVGYSVTFGNGYLEQGSYAEAIASTGAEPGLVDAGTPRAAFTASVVAPLAGAAGGGIALLDVDADGDLDLFVAAPGGERLFENQGGGRWGDVTAASALPQGRDAIGAAAADYDNDGRTDLIVLRRQGSALYHNEGGGRFSDVTARARLQNMPVDPGAAAWGDIDHDGDVDLVISRQASSAAPLRLLRNNGDGTFADISAAAGLDVPVRALAIAPTDFDNRRDLDLLVANEVGSPNLFRNLRDGRFRDVAAETGLASIVGTERTSAMAAGDVNKDDYPDFLFARPSGAVFAMSDGRGGFRAQPAPTVAEPPLAAQLFDYDNDGLLDLLLSSAGGTRLWRNAGREWIDVTGTALSATAGAAASSERGLAVADLDATGTADVAMLTSDSVVVLTNAGDPSRRSQRVQLRGRVGNRLGLGAKVQLRAGSLSARVETSAATPMVAPADVVFGLGNRPGADAIRVLWPSGILQAEVVSAPPSLPAAPGPPAPMVVEELDRKPSSCPFLFTWNGERFEFVTDFLGAGEMGYWEAPGVRSHPDPIEYVRIPGDRLRPRNGRLELRVTNELEEALFVDRLQMLAIAHPSTIEIYPNEGMTTPPKPFRIFQVADERVPRAIDDHGHDVTERIARVDRTYPDDFALERIRGYAKGHTLTLDLGAAAERGGRNTLLLTAWTDYAFSSDNVAASQLGLSLTPPALDVKDRRGQWRRVLDQIGIPVGRPQTIPIDLSPLLRPHEREVRIVTTMRIYWDRIAIGRPVPEPLEPIRVDAASATLRSRGFSAELRPGGAGPLVYDYSRVSRTSPWKILTGHYTREGDVLELVAHSDDRFVIAAPGDEIAVDFEAGPFGQLPDGWRRTFLLYADGFSKEMDINSATPDHVEPLPFHAMSGYPYPSRESYPDTPEHETYRRMYNTRYLARPLPPTLVDAAR